MVTVVDNDVHVNLNVAYFTKVNLHTIDYYQISAN